MQGKVLANYCETDSDMVAEQKRIEKQITDFENNVWGNGFLADTTQTDSLSAEMAAGEQKSSKGQGSGRRSSKSKSTAASASAKQDNSSSKREKGDAPTNTSARVSARRQRR